MESQVVNDQNLAETLKAIQEQLAVLTDRVAALEARAPVPADTGTDAGEQAQAAAQQAAPEPMSDETLLVLSAAIAAFVGKRPRIRQIRLVSSTTWAQQGRVGIHASHAFPKLSRSGATS